MSKFSKMTYSLRELNVETFKNTYKKVVEDMVQQERWTEEEREAMRLLKEGNFFSLIRKRMTLDEESNKKIADLYFMVLLNSLIRSKVQVPFKLPEKEITAWSKDYPRDKFVSELQKHKAELNKSAIGKEIIKTAADYATLYENTSGKTLSKRNQASTHKVSSVEDKIVDSLSFLWGVANGLTSNPRQPYSPPFISPNNAATLGYGAGIFAQCIFELGGLAVSLMKK
ncbi:hypothetical protein ACQUW5_08405 [Legionella sp. CNM-1927-20]|uniref:hypothetical protein n=1 Tax=Legionella sp. CNM-1927-20 TaxID=3422221 RepID=UPI00403AD1EA